jgi:hypothetical protein
MGRLLENSKITKVSELTEDMLGNKFWNIDNGYHRLDGPALEYADGYKAWYVNGKRHRLDGPAVEYASGSREWWVDGKRIVVWRS